MDKYFRGHVKKVTCFFAVLFILNSNAQEIGFSAEQIYQDYSKFGLIVGMSLLYTENEPNAVDYTYITQKAFNLGIEYNILQTHRFSFRTAFIYRTYDIKNTKYIKGQDFGEDFDVFFTSGVGPFKQFKVPLDAQYYFPINKTLSSYVSVGPEFIIYPEDPTSGGLSIGNFDPFVGYTEEGNSKDGWLYVGANLSLGLAIKTNIALIKPFVTYHYQPETLYTNVVTTQNLMVSENTVSKHKIKGDYLLFGIILNPAKSLYKKSKG